MRRSGGAFPPKRRKQNKGGGGGGGRGGGARGGGGGGNRGGYSSWGNSGVGNRRPGICFDFQNGYCRYGSSCKFLHGTAGGGQNKGGVGNAGNFRGPPGGGGGAGRNVQNSNRLIKQLKNTQLNQLADAIAHAGPLWNECWGDAASSPRMAVGAIEVLVNTLAKVPYSQESQVTPPPIRALSGAMKRYLTSSEVDPLLAAETALNVVRKALCFEWEEKKTVVKEALGTILEDAANNLQRRNQDHRDCMNRIDTCLDKLEKPWSIKEKNQGLPTMTGETGFGQDSGEIESAGVPHTHYSNWRNATIKWLVHPPTFCPSELPRMQGPSTKSRGVYKNRDQYFDTMQRLMIAMAFYEGHCAISPKCWERGGGGQTCGATLVRCPDDYDQHDDSGKKGSGKNSRSSGPLRCRGRGCPNTPILICKIASHSRGLCERCAHHEMGQLLGPTG